MSKKKRVNLVLASLALIASVGVLTSCSSFFGSDGYSISDVSKTTNQNGDTVITIHYTDESVDPTVISIPKGIAGEDGNGIKDIQTSTDEDQSTLTLRISYTDSTKPDTVLSFPLRQGKGVSNVAISNDEAGNVVVVFEYTDGTSSDKIVIPKGKDGVGIKAVNVTPDTESTLGGYVITISYTDESLPDSVFKINNGRGVESVARDESQDTEDELAMVVYYTDGTLETFKIPRPHGTTWHTGEHDPDATLGKDGDFYLNKNTGYVYRKESGAWVFVLSMRGTGSATTYVVTFLANGGAINLGGTSTDNASFVVEYGKTLEFSKIPVPTYEGHTFKGWYTTATEHPNSGRFTDLTPVTDTMTLYAHWSEIASGN